MKAPNSDSEFASETKSRKMNDSVVAVVSAAPSVATNSALKSPEDTAVMLGRALLIKMKIEMALNAKGWYYKDSTEHIQGPFDGSAMASWYSAGYLKSDLLISSSLDGEFYSLAAIMEGSPDPEVAFEEELHLRDLAALRAQLANL